MTFTPDTWIQAAIAAANRQAGEDPAAADIFFVNVTANGEGEEITYSADKTYVEILEAIEDGKYGYALYDGRYYPLSGTNPPYGAYFCCDYALDSILYSETIIVEMGEEETDTDVSYASVEYTLTPAE